MRYKYVEDIKPVASCAGKWSRQKKKCDRRLWDRNGFVLLQNQAWPSISVRQKVRGCMGKEGQNLIVPYYVAMIRDLKYYEKQLGDGGSPQPRSPSSSILKL